MGNWNLPIRKRHVAMTTKKRWQWQHFRYGIFLQPYSFKFEAVRKWFNISLWLQVGNGWSKDYNHHKNKCLLLQASPIVSSPNWNLIPPFASFPHQLLFASFVCYMKFHSCFLSSSSILSLIKEKYLEKSVVPLPRILTRVAYWLADLNF